MLVLLVQQGPLKSFILFTSFTNYKFVHVHFLLFDFFVLHTHNISELYPQSAGHLVNLLLSCKCGQILWSLDREPPRAPKGGQLLQELALADSAEESPYLHPASKSRFAQHKGHRSEQRQQEQGISTMNLLLVLSIPNIVWRVVSTRLYMGVSALAHSCSVGCSCLSDCSSLHVTVAFAIVSVLCPRHSTCTDAQSTFGHVHHTVLARHAV